jgi:hypothetical protein
MGSRGERWAHCTGPTIVRTIASKSGIRPPAQEALSPRFARLQTGTVLATIASQGSLVALHLYQAQGCYRLAVGYNAETAVSLLLVSPLLLCLEQNTSALLRLMRPWQTTG